jgi:hypothetical protein
MWVQSPTSAMQHRCFGAFTDGLALHSAACAGAGRQLHAKFAATKAQVLAIVRPPPPFHRLHCQTCFVC